MESEEVDWWLRFLEQYQPQAIEHAFDKWLAERTGEEWWPTAARIGELCGEYRTRERQQLLPVGCERCDWTGYYMTKASRTIEGNENREGRELAAECPCRRDASLRTPCTKRRASDEELRAMWTLAKEVAAKGMPEEKPVAADKKQVGNVVPTTKELAEQLGKLKPAQRALVEYVRKGLEQKS